MLSVFIFGCIRMFLASTRSNKPLLNIVFTVGGDFLVAHEGQDASFHEKKEENWCLKFFSPWLNGSRCSPGHACPLYCRVT